jgi:hypothetical protein
MAKFLAVDQGYDFKVGEAGMEMMRKDCSSSGGEGEFLPEEFVGLVVLCTLICLAGLAQNLWARRQKSHREIKPADIESKPGPGGLPIIHEIKPGSNTISASMAFKVPGKP